jgi:hypothetical protein
LAKTDAKISTDEEKQKDHNALSLIQLTISIIILQEVLLEKAEAAMWLKLVSI